ncbi:MAG TPA: protein kinase [Polyangiales bacterium]|nr:protein kinase [Polyangiales bacterium]
MPKSLPLPDLTGGLIGGRFLVEDALGRGGMASVYRVRDVKTGEKLALKRSWARDSQRALRRRALLEREFHTLAQLSHPRIIEVYDYGVDEDGPYFTMELLDGADLDRAGPLPWQEACALLRDIASSLAILHSRGWVHRDVSARNVRRTADGRAKLLDFGAMVSIGVANDVVGTPPFMSPEVLQMQALDARADLFSFGALGYYLLTGRHAYAARRTSELRDVWRSRPTPPAKLQPDVPAPLSALIMQLLALDRGARPQNAGEVMERLCTIANLPKEELPEISRAYLSTPTLVGRHKTLLAIRSHMLSLVRGDGGALLLEGSSGSGRSRMIDACVFEGKLLSAQVVRAGAEDATGPWGVARAIASQLFAALPEQSTDATRLSAGVLCHVIEEVRRDSTNSMSLGVPERSLILRELRDFVLALARRHRLLITVDDADRIDEPSAAWLAALADKTERQGLMLVLAMEPERASESARPQHLFRSLAHRVTLQPLDAEQTEALMRSVFGDAQNLGVWAGRIHALALGNPRTTMELAQHLVDKGLARYEAGSWLLPTAREQIDLPRTLSESLASRLAGLSADARELAEALSIADPQTFPLSGYRSLTRHRDQKRLFNALEELVSARILIAGAERYQFSQRGLVSVISADMNESRKKAIHARLAELLALGAGDVVQRAQHLMAAERPAEAVQLLCSTDLLAKPPPVALLERALVYAEQKGELSARAIQRLRMALLSKAALVGALDQFKRWLPPALAQLQYDSGLSLYGELADVPKEARLAQALSQQQQRYLNTPENQQVYPVGDALRELARLIGASCSMATSTFDLELLESLPSLEPLLPLSPAIRVVDQIVRASQHWIAGRVERSIELFQATLARIAEPDRAGLDESQYQRTQLGIEYVLALMEATLGSERAEERAQLLELHRGLRVNAWRVRMLACVSRGDNQGAQKCARRAELLLLQDEVETHYQGTSTGFQLNACFMAEDLLGVKSAVDELQELAHSQPGWKPMLVLGHSFYRYLQGDLQGALHVLEPGFEIAKPGRHMVFAFMSAHRVRVLVELGRVQEALDAVHGYLQVAAREQLTTAERLLKLAHTRVLMELGRLDEALAVLEPMLHEAEQYGTSGLQLGVFYELRTRIAILANDRPAYATNLQRCAQEYKKGRNTSLNAKFARLLEYARVHGFSPQNAQLDKLGALEGQPAPHEDDGSVVSRMLECVDTADRARCALTMLLQSTDSYLGHLYGIERSGLVPLAALPEVTPDPALVAWLEQWVTAEREQLAATVLASSTTTVSDQPPPLSDSVHTASADSEVPPPQGRVPSLFSDAEGRSFRAVLLSDMRNQPRRLIAVLVSQTNEDQRYRPPQPLLAQLAAQLADHGDVRGVGPEDGASVLANS